MACNFPTDIELSSAKKQNFTICQAVSPRRANDNDPGRDPGVGAGKKL
jgi:hypothetical protein